MLINPLITVTLLLVGVVATLVVLTPDPMHQTIGISFYGVCLTILFLLLEAPDVALAQLGVGAVALPIVLLLAISKLKRRAKTQQGEKKQ